MATRVFLSVACVLCFTLETAGKSESTANVSYRDREAFNNTQNQQDGAPPSFLAPIFSTRSVAFIHNVSVFENQQDGAPPSFPESKFSKRTSEEFSLHDFASKNQQDGAPPSFLVPTNSEPFIQKYSTRRNQQDGAPPSFLVPTNSDPFIQKYSTRRNQQDGAPPLFTAPTFSTKNGELFIEKDSVLNNQQYKTPPSLASSFSTSINKGFETQDITALYNQQDGAPPSSQEQIYSKGTSKNVDTQQNCSLNIQPDSAPPSFPTQASSARTSKASVDNDIDTQDGAPPTFVSILSSVRDIANECEESILQPRYSRMVNCIKNSILERILPMITTNGSTISVFNGLLEVENSEGSNLTLVDEYYKRIGRNGREDEENEEELSEEVEEEHDPQEYIAELDRLSKKMTIRIKLIPGLILKMARNTEGFRVGMELDEKDFQDLQGKILITHSMAQQTLKSVDRPIMRVL